MNFEQRNSEEMYNPFQQQTQNTHHTHHQSQEHEGSSSLLKNARQGFVRKVFSILSVQLTLTALMIFMSQSNLSFRRFQSHNDWALYMAAATCFVSQILITCVESFSKKVPLNYITLGIFTMSEAYAVSAYTIHYDKIIVLKAALLVAAATLSLCAYAATTKKDISIYNSVLFIALFSMFSVSILNLFFFRSTLLQMGVEYLSVLVYCFYLIYDIQLVMGNNSLKLELDNYILGAALIYTDIIQLFIKILKILGTKEDEEENKKKKK